MSEFTERSFLMPSLRARVLFIHRHDVQLFGKGFAAGKGSKHQDRRRSRQDPAGLVLPECSVDVFPPALRRPFAAGYLASCGKKIVFPAEQDLFDDEW